MINKMGDVFWIEKPKSLVDNTCLIPTKNMSTQEKLNSLSRLIIITSIAIAVLDIKIAIKFVIIGMFLLISYNYCAKDDEKSKNNDGCIPPIASNTGTSSLASQAIGSDNMGLTLGYSDSYAPRLITNYQEDSLLAVNNPNYNPFPGDTDIGPRDPESRAERFNTEVHSAGLVGAIGNGGYGNYAPNSNANTALFVGTPFEEAQTGSLNDANSDSAKTIVHDEDPEENLPPDAMTQKAGYGVGGGWGHGWAPSTGLSFHPDLIATSQGSLAYENDPGSNFIEQVSSIDGRDSYATLGEDMVYKPYNVAYNDNPNSGYPTPEGVSGQKYLNTVYVSPAQTAHPDAGSAVPNAGTQGLNINGVENQWSQTAAAGAERIGLKKKATNPYITSMVSNAGASSMEMNGMGSREGNGFIHTNTGGTVPIAGSPSDYSHNGYSNLYSGDSGNNSPENYVTLDKRQPINRNAFINGQNISSYQPVTFTDPIDRSERLDAKTFQLWKDLTLFDQNPPRDSTNAMMEFAGTEKIADQSYEPTYYKDANRREEIKKSTFSSFMNERIAQDQGILDDVPEFRKQMMRDYTPLRRRPMSFRGGNNAPREFATPGNIPLTPLRPPMTPSPATPGF